MLIVIPAAGFGTRMNVPTNKSKEMLGDPYNDNKPLIQWTLDLVKDYSKVVITREEKTDLIDYLAEQQIFTLLINDTTKEVPNTILYSKEHWEEKNILVFSDTRFTPSIIEQIDKELETYDLVFPVFPVEDVRLWGKVLLDPFTQRPLATVEKEEIKFKLEGLAWGLIGFKKSIGEKLFQAYLNKEYFTFPKNWKVKVLKLESFKDITRTGTIEEY